MLRQTITIKDIARELNISVSTVSRALRDAFDVSLETKQMVLEKAKELNYKPNYNARGLSQGKTNNIGVIIPFITNYYFSTVITGIQKIAYEYNYNIVLYLTNDAEERECQIMNNLILSGLDGILISTCASNYDHIHKIMDKGVPVVFFDRTNSLNASKVKQDDYNGAFEATSHLISQGFTKIAHITGPKDQMFTQNRLNGYLNALEHHNLPVRKKWIIHNGFSQECGAQDLQKLMAKSKKPEAIFAVNDRKAIGAMVELKQQNIQIGKDFGVVGFTNDPICTLITPTLTTVSESAFEIGSIACELLLKHIQKENLIPKEVILPGELIIRESSMRSSTVVKKADLP
ncbi:LacI family DNA-binding transcriptional regulator [Cyclobacterium marinum]|uniref:Transcriptional regulator, LacI family n=1 Tax=Cyclobacterium marinum (strain ATCC 25205 / DSM 745 / LMG 13164 / NCIMB 1802) TaxID=880070 RepID=G0J426_CYCMS|nr:LacI family DNA-binding transcriptional regulator [Cyclobacterium marinum]AEL26692.1 transcriptional regulator, LacI family [Cyclobacterium marinum DSM 745]MBR9773962.1 LacI family transcriptional regulator [Cytophagales bacterium]|tara:strand:+ start:17047 stop:18084 length:1038 start_codon:yes stop_codon:yes gene_type:complete